MLRALSESELAFVSGGDSAQEKEKASVWDEVWSSITNIFDSNIAKGLDALAGFYVNGEVKAAASAAGWGAGEASVAGAVAGVAANTAVATAAGVTFAAGNYYMQQVLAPSARAYYAQLLNGMSGAVAGGLGGGDAITFQ